jgi:hypothetical protein
VAVCDSAEGKYYAMCIHTQNILLWGRIHFVRLDYRKSFRGLEYDKNMNF